MVDVIRTKSGKEYILERDPAGKITNAEQLMMSTTTFEELFALHNELDKNNNENFNIPVVLKIALPQCHRDIFKKAWGKASSPAELYLLSERLIKDREAHKLLQNPILGVKINGQDATEALIKDQYRERIKEIFSTLSESEDHPEKIEYSYENAVLIDIYIKLKNEKSLAAKLKEPLPLPVEERAQKIIKEITNGNIKTKGFVEGLLFLQSKVTDAAQKKVLIEQAVTEFIKAAVDKDFEKSIGKGFDETQQKLLEQIQTLEKLTNKKNLGKVTALDNNYQIKFLSMSSQLKLKQKAAAERAKQEAERAKQEAERAKQEAAERAKQEATERAKQEVAEDLDGPDPVEQNRHPISIEESGPASQLSSLTKAGVVDPKPPPLKIEIESNDTERELNAEQLEQFKEILNSKYFKAGIGFIGTSETGKEIIERQTYSFNPSVIPEMAEEYARYKEVRLNVFELLQEFGEEYANQFKDKCVEKAEQTAIILQAPQAQATQVENVPSLIEVVEMRNDCAVTLDEVIIKELQTLIDSEYFKEDVGIIKKDSEGNYQSSKVYLFSKVDIPKIAKEVVKEKFRKADVLKLLQQAEKEEGQDDLVEKFEEQMIIVEENNKEFEDPEEDDVYQGIAALFGENEEEFEHHNEFDDVWDILESCKLDDGNALLTYDYDADENTDLNIDYEADANILILKTGGTNNLTQHEIVQIKDAIFSLDKNSIKIENTDGGFKIDLTSLAGKKIDARIITNALDVIKEARLKKANHSVPPELGLKSSPGPDLDSTSLLGSAAIGAGKAKGLGSRRAQTTPSKSMPEIAKALNHQLNAVNSAPSAIAVAGLKLQNALAPLAGKLSQGASGINDANPFLNDKMEGVIQVQEDSTHNGTIQYTNGKFVCEGGGENTHKASLMALLAAECSPENLKDVLAGKDVPRTSDKKPLVLEINQPDGSLLPDDYRDKLIDVARNTFGIQTFKIGNQKEQVRRPDPDTHGEKAVNSIQKSMQTQQAKLKSTPQSQAAQAAPKQNDDPTLSGSGSGPRPNK